MVQKQGESLEKALLTEAISLDNIDDYISMAVKPFKTILIYLKRGLNTEKEAIYIKLWSRHGQLLDLQELLQTFLAFGRHQKDEKLFLDSHCLSKVLSG